MNFLTNILNTSYDCSVQSPERQVSFVYCKLVEECCELSDVYHGIAMSEPLSGEVVDVVISALDLMFVTGPYGEAMANMTREEVLDSFISKLAFEIFVEADGDTITNEWVRYVDWKPEKYLSLMFHHLSNITRLLNQPDRCKLSMEKLVVDICTSAIRVLTASYYHQNMEINMLRAELNDVFDLKIGKWRNKFGL